MSDGQHSHHHRPPPAEGGIGGGQECVLCPVCVLLQAVSSTRPDRASVRSAPADRRHEARNDVTRHLLAAGRELTLALQALLEQQLEAYEEAHDEASGDAGAGLERIDVD